jgi:formylglycine-generating enzyme required for sulfatase activity/uncharacterized protein YjdB
LRALLIALQVCLLAALCGACSAPNGNSSKQEPVGTASADLTGVTLKSIAVTPSPTTLFAGVTEALTATGFYSNATTQNITSSVTWTSSNPNVATVSSAGVVTTVSHGTASITAQSGTVKAKATVTVSVTLMSLAVTPASTTLPANATQALKATGSYDNNTSKNLTSSVTWTSNNPSVATVTSAGLLVTVGPGTTTVMASASGSSAAPVVGMATITVDSATATSVAVTPVNKNLPEGTKQQFKATATFSDGTTQVLVPPVVSWTSSSPSIATVSATGLASSVTVGGPLLITATPLGSTKTGTAALTVTAATLVSIAVTPSTSSVSAGLTQQYTATGTYTDGSTVDITGQVTWSSSVTATATITTAGLATTLVAGSVTITATDPKTKKTGTAALTVTPPVLQSIALSPPSPSVPAGLTIQLDAVGTWTDGSTQDVTATDTWTSSATNIATVSAGLVTGVAQGTTTITVKDSSGVSQFETLVVTPGLLVSIAITPSNPSVPLDTTTQLVATGTYTDGTTGNITLSSMWASTTASVAVANAPGPAGQVTALSLGSSVVSATDPTSGLVGQTTVTAAPAILETLTVTPSPVSLLTGQTQQLTATGTMSDGTSVGYTGTVTWSSSASSVYVSTGQSTGDGLAIGVSVGGASVTATDPTTGVTTSVPVTVALNANDDAAQEFTPYVNPVGNWAFGWEASAGATFSAFPSWYNSGGSAVDYWYATDSANQTLYAAHNATTSTQTFDDAPLSSGQLVLVPSSVAADASQADARWTAPAAGVYQITATFSGTSDTPLCQPVTTCTPYTYECDPYVCGEYICGSYQCNGYCCGVDFFGGCIGNYCYETCYDYCNSWCYHTCTATSCSTNTVCTTPVTTTSVAVLQNGQSAFAGFINLNGGGNTQAYTATLQLNAGDTLDFQVGNGGDANNYDATLFDAQIQTCASAGLTACGSTCSNTASDPNNCGACGTVCATTDPNAASVACVASQCLTTCNVGYTECNNICVNQQTDPNNCGGCGVGCSGATPSCAGGACISAASCQTSGDGLTDCGASSESCCTSLEVQGGTYFRTYTNPGSGPTGEADPATISGFQLDKYEVTVARFRQFYNAWSAGWVPPPGSGVHAHLNGGLGLQNSNSPGTYEPGWLASDNANIFPPGQGLSDCATVTWTPSPGANESLPINCATWYGAYAFCIWDGGFLPSEAEWEYAAAGGSEQLEYPWGSTDPGTGNQYAIFGSNYTGNSLGIAPVGSATLGVGLWGQLDWGNVKEWNLDYWHPSFLDPCVDCAYLTDDSYYRILRGGYYNGAQSDLLPSTRGASTLASPGISTYYTGVRCARAP